MARSSANSLLNTLRGKIWISTSVLAFFICTFGLISYLVVTLLTNNPFYSVFIPFIFLSFCVIVFGWWLSNELVNPIDNVILLGKSLERNSSTSLPKSSGTAETDQLLQTLYRNSKQMQNVITLMDKVANGNIDIALTPIKGSDRLTASFQKLLTKVSESINAKEDLTKLQNEIQRIKSEIGSVRNGNLHVELESEYFHTKEITETIKYLVENLTMMVSLMKVDTFDVQDSAIEIDKSLESIIKQDETMIQKMNQASITLKQVPNLIEKITADLTRSANSAKQTIEKTRRGTEISQENAEAVSKLRRNLRESINRTQGLNERSHEIAKVAKTVDDLANRTNMIALNASIQATEFGEDGQKFVLVSEELERLAARADGTNKQISILNNTILSEIGRVEDSLETTLGGVAGLSKHSIETANVLNELERYIGQFLSLQENLIAFSKDQSEETNEAFETVVSSISETENSIKELIDSAVHTKKISNLMNNLQSHSAEFRVTPQIINTETDYYTAKSVEEQISTIEESNNIEEVSDNEDFSTDEFNNAKLSTEEFQLMTDVSDEEDAGESNSNEADSTKEVDSIESVETSFDKSGQTISDENNLDQSVEPNSDDTHESTKDKTVEHKSDAIEETKSVSNDLEASGSDKSASGDMAGSVTDNKILADSEDSNSVEKISEEFDSDEFNISDYDSRDFDSTELFSKEFRNIDLANDESNSTDSDTDELIKQSYAAGDFDSKEFLNDDMSIDMNHFEHSDDDDEASSESRSLSKDDQTDDLLNLTPQQNQDQNPDLTA